VRWFGYARSFAKALRSRQGFDAAVGSIADRSSRMFLNSQVASR
jgi:hypothetical protein